MLINVFRTVSSVEWFWEQVIEIPIWTGGRCSTVWIDDYLLRNRQQRRFPPPTHFSVLKRAISILCNSQSYTENLQWNFTDKDQKNASRRISLLTLCNEHIWEIPWGVNKNPTRCYSMQIFIICKVTLHVSGVIAPIIRSTKNCNRNLRYRS